MQRFFWNIFTLRTQVRPWWLLISTLLREPYLLDFEAHQPPLRYISSKARISRGSLQTVAFKLVGVSTRWSVVFNIGMRHEIASMHQIQVNEKELSFVNDRIRLHGYSMTLLRDRYLLGFEAHQAPSCYISSEAHISRSSLRTVAFKLVGLSTRWSVVFNIGMRLDGAIAKTVFPTWITWLLYDTIERTILTRFSSTSGAFALNFFRNSYLAQFAPNRRLQAQQSIDSMQGCRLCDKRLLSR